MFQIYKDYMEFFFFILVVLGIMIALLSGSAAVSYFIIFLAGMLAGRVIYERKHRNIKFPYYVIVAGFLIGYLIGAYYGNRWVVIILFLIGAVSSYKLYDRKILKDTKF